MSDTGHTVKSYAEEMQSLNDDLIKLGSLTESQLADAMEAVIKLDKESVDKIVGIIVILDYSIEQLSKYGIELENWEEDAI